MRKGKLLRHLRLAAAACVLYVVLVWLLNADFAGIQLMLRLHGFWAEVYYWSIFVALYAAAGSLLLLGIIYLRRLMTRKTR